MPNLVAWYRTLNSLVRNFEKTRTEFQEILAKPIRELGLKLEGSPLERFVQQLYRELEAKGVHKFRPLCYLTDEWGCPSGEPVIGIPFYLANLTKFVELAWGRGVGSSNLFLRSHLFR